MKKFFSPRKNHTRIFFPIFLADAATAVAVNDATAVVVQRQRPALCRNGIIFQYGRTDDTGSVFVDVFGINVLLPVTENTNAGVGILVDACFIIVRSRQ